MNAQSFWAAMESYLSRCCIEMYQDVSRHLSFESVFLLFTKPGDNPKYVRMPALHLCDVYFVSLETTSYLTGVTGEVLYWTRSWRACKSWDTWCDSHLDRLLSSLCVHSQAFRNCISNHLILDFGFQVRSKFVPYTISTVFYYVQ